VFPIQEVWQVHAGLQYVHGRTSCSEYGDRSRRIDLIAFDWRWHAKDAEANRRDPSSIFAAVILDVEIMDKEAYELLGKIAIALMGVGGAYLVFRAKQKADAATKFRETILTEYRCCTWVVTSPSRSLLRNRLRVYLERTFNLPSCTVFIS
jgi:hypothetical protein